MTTDFHPDKCLPECMMPDGGECCKGYVALYDAYRHLKEQASMTGWAAWHPVHGFQTHFEGPIVYVDLDEALLADIADLNDSEPRRHIRNLKEAKLVTGWRAVKVEVRKVP